jgi:hypothetical protein
VSLYSPQGEPIRTVTLPPTEDGTVPGIAYDGKRVVITGENGIVIFEASGKPLGRFNPTHEEQEWWTPFLADDGRALLLFDGTKTLHRFGMP